MTTLFNEAEADAEVAKVLARHKREHTMQVVLFKDENGEIHQSTESRMITREEIEEKLKKAQQQVAAFTETLRLFNQLSAPKEEPKVEEPQHPTLEVQPEQPQPNSQPEPAPAPQPPTPVVNDVQPPAAPSEQPPIQLQ